MAGALLDLCFLEQMGVWDKGIPDEQNPDLAGVCSSPPALSGLGNRCSLHASLLILAFIVKTITWKAGRKVGRME